MTKNNYQGDIKDFMDKVKKIEKNEKIDLSSDEDLSIAIMNLISIEEHLFFSGGKTGKSEYFDLISQVRDMRKELLKKIIKEYEGEVWCISKHLLAASMRLMEVGTKMLGKGKKEEADGMFKKSYNLYSLFWGLNLGLVKMDNVKQDEKEGLTFISESADSVETKTEKMSLFEKLGKIVQKAVDCCKE